MKIGIICYPSIGGSGLVATELGLDLARRGHQVHFISYAAPFKLPSFNPNVQFHAVDPINYPLFNHTLYTFSLTAKIIEVVNEYNLDLVHAHYSIPHSLCAHLAREVTGKTFKIVTTLHGTDVTIVGQNKPLFSLNKYGIERSDLVTTVSRYQQEHTREHFNISNDLRVIYNFVNTNVFKPGGGTVSPCLRDGEQKIVMHVSNFRPLKNIEGVVRTFYHVQMEVAAKLVLVGDGPLIGEIRNLCRELDICQRVCFLGQMDNVETVLPAADCVLQPSYREAFGLALLEAMACEVPTVSSNVDGIPELVIHGETGFYAEPDDHVGMAGYIVDILRSKDLSLTLGAKGRQRAVEQFDTKVIVPQYIRCYEEVLARA